MDENQFEDQFSSNEYFKWYEDYNFLNTFWTKFLKKGGTFINMPNPDLDILDQADYLSQDYPNNNNFSEDIYLPDEIDAMNFFCDNDVSMILYKSPFDYVSFHLGGSNTNLVTLERIKATIGVTTASQGMTESNVGIATTNVEVYIQCEPEPINNLRFNVNTLNVGIGGNGNVNIKGNTDIDGTLDVGSNAHIGGNLRVDGCISVDYFCDYIWLDNYLGTNGIGIGTFNYDQPCDFPINNGSDSYLKTELSILDGNLTLVGNGNQNQTYSSGPYVSVVGIGSTNQTTGDTYPGLNVYNFSNVSYSSGELGFYKSGLTNSGVGTICNSDNDYIGYIFARSQGDTEYYGCSHYENAASIWFQLNSRNVTGSGNHPSADIIFNGRSSTSSGRYDNSEWMRIKGDTGNIGIGTTNPEYTLDVYGDSKFSYNYDPSDSINQSPYRGVATIVVGNNNTSANTHSSISFSANDSTNVGRHGAAISMLKDGTWTGGSGSYPGHLVFWTRPSSSGDELERMRILSSGSVGIATTNPTSKLHVVGDTLITGITTVGLGTTSAPSNSQLTFELTSNTNLRIKVRGTDGVLRSANITLA